MELFVDATGFTDPVTYNLVLKASDPELHSATVTFDLKIKKCYSTCGTCTDDGEADCLTCITSYYFYQNQCLDTCNNGKYHDTTITDVLTCATCPTGCSECSGDDHTSECSECDAGYGAFLGTDQLTTIGCYYFCPENYKYDPVTTNCIAVQSSVRYQACLDFIANFESYITHPYVESFPNMGTSNVLCKGISTTCPDYEEDATTGE